MSNALALRWARIWRRAARIGCFATFGIGLLGAQGTGAPPTQTQRDITPLQLPAPVAETSVAAMQADLAVPEVPDNYTIGANDLLSVFVFQMPEISSQVRVSSDGNVRLPLVSSGISALGRTAPELSSDIAARLKRDGLAADPRVRVVVREVESRPIVVTGSVKNPMVIQAIRPMSLLEVLARTGGVETTAGTAVLLTEKTADGTHTRRIDLESIVRSADPVADPELQGGEAIRVLPAQLIYATGALLKPGAFPIEAGEPITVLRALALAQGFNPTVPADRSHSMIIRSSASGPTEIPVNLDQILKHHAEDPILEAGDLLYVPENRSRKFAAAALADAGQALVLAIGYNLKAF